MLLSGLRIPCEGYFEELVVLFSDDIYEYFFSWESSLAIPMHTFFEGVLIAFTGERIFAEGMFCSWETAVVVTFWEVIECGEILFTGDFGSLLDYLPKVCSFWSFNKFKLSIFSTNSPSFDILISKSYSQEILYSGSVCSIPWRSASVYMDIFWISFLIVSLLSAKRLISLAIDFSSNGQNPNSNS